MISFIVIWISIMINPGSQPMYQRTIEQQCARSRVASMLPSPSQCWLVSNDNDDNHGQRRPWLRWWSWSSSVMLNGIELMGALWDKFQASALPHSLHTSHVFLESTLDPPPTHHIWPSWSPDSTYELTLTDAKYLQFTTLKNTFWRQMAI